MPLKKHPCVECGRLVTRRYRRCESCSRKRIIMACRHVWLPSRGPERTQRCPLCNVIRRLPRVCVHYWVVDAKNVGICKKCGATADFAVRLTGFLKSIEKKGTLVPRWFGKGEVNDVPEFKESYGLG